MFAKKLAFMKVKFVSVFFLAAMATFFVACDDQSSSQVESPNNAPLAAGEISLDGHSSSAKSGIFQYSTQPVGAGIYYRHELGLITQGFTAKYDESAGLMLLGEGTGIWLTINAPSASLSPGIYRFTESPATAEAFDFWYGSVDAKGKRYRFTSGEITVKENSGRYSITVAGTIVAVDSMEKKEIKARYDGSLQIFQSK
jgi:hypothetical protein